MFFGVLSFLTMLASVIMLITGLVMLLIGTNMTSITITFASIFGLFLGLILMMVGFMIRDCCESETEMEPSATVVVEISKEEVPKEEQDCYREPYSIKKNGEPYPV